MEPESERCPNCRRLLFKLSKNCPWCGKQLLPESPLKQIDPTPKPATVPVGPDQQSNAVRRRKNVYKVAIVVLLVTTIVSSTLLANYTLVHFGGAGLPKVSYAIDRMGKSSNWSGYAVSAWNGSIFDVQASIKVPHYRCPTSNASAGFWVGIDGHGSNTVEQVGVITDCALGTLTFWQWYPAPAYSRAGATPREDDTLNLEVNYDGNQFIGTIKDVTQGWTYIETSTSIVPRAERVSAEWITEAPVVNGSTAPLADFGKAFFSNCHATIGSRNGSLESFPLVELTMIDKGKIAKAEPVLPLVGDGASFSVWWIAPGP